MSETAIPFSFKLLLEGVEVPFVSATVAVGRDGPAQASISLAPTAALTLLEPKTLVHIFFRGEADAVWRLLYEGETSGDAPSRDPSNRTHTINAEGLTNNWFRCKIYMVNGTGPYDGSEPVQLAGTASLDSKNAYQVASDWSDYSTFVTGNKGDPVNPGTTYKSLLGRIENVNGYFKGVETRLKLKERIYAAPDKNLKELMQSKLFFDKVFNAEAGATLSATAPVIQLVNVLTEMTYYEWVEVLAPSSMTKQIIFKPKLYFAPPPKCNVLFPGRYTTQGGSRDYMSEPTRLIASLASAIDTNEQQNVVSSLYFYSPEELTQAVDVILGKFPPGADGPKLQADLKALNNTFLTEEEKIKGIVDSYVNFTTAEWSVFAADGSGRNTDKDAQQKYIQQITDFKFATQRFQNRSRNYGAAFNPYHVVGFPFLALSSAGNSLGMLDSMSHTFSPRGGSTSLTVTFNREIGVRFKGASGRVRTFGAERFAFPKAPPWMNGDYLNGAAYAAAIGSPSISANGEEAIRTQAFELYDSVTNNPETAQEFSLAFNKRPIVSESAYMEFVGVTGSREAQANAMDAATDAAAALATAQAAFASARIAADSSRAATVVADRTAAQAALTKAQADVNAANTARATLTAEGDVQVYSGGPFRKSHQSVILEHVNIIGGNDALEGF